MHSLPGREDSPEAVLKAIDDFAWTEQWMMRLRHRLCSWRAGLVVSAQMNLPVPPRSSESRGETSDVLIGLCGSAGRRKPQCPRDDVDVPQTARLCRPVGLQSTGIQLIREGEKGVYMRWNLKSTIQGLPSTPLLRDVVLLLSEMFCGEWLHVSGCSFNSTSERMRDTASWRSVGFEKPRVHLFMPTKYGVSDGFGSLIT